MELDMSIFGDEDFSSEDFLENLEDETVQEEDKKDKKETKDKSKDDLLEDLPDEVQIDDGDDEEDDNIGRDSKNNSQTLYSTLITTLSESLPYFSGDEAKEIKDTETFLDYIETKIESEVNSREFSELTDAQKEYLEALKVGIPHEDIANTLKVEDSIDSITDDQLEEDDDLREQIIMQSYLSQGLSEAKAKRFTRMSIEAGTDVEDAKEGINNLKEGIKARKAAKIQAAKEEAKAKEAQRIQSIKKLKDAIDNPKDVIGEDNLTKKVKNDMYNLITKPSKTLEDGSKVNALEEFLITKPVESRVTLSYLYTITDGFKPEKLKELNPKKQKSRASKELDKLLTESSTNLGSDMEDNFFNNEADFDFSQLDL